MEIIFEGRERCGLFERGAYNMLERLYFREKREEAQIFRKERMKIGVAGVCGGVGTSFVACLLAKALSEQKNRKVAFVEAGAVAGPAGGSTSSTCLYHSLGMDRRFDGRVFTDYFRTIATGEPVGDRCNMEERINWALAVPGAPGAWEHRELKAEDYCYLVNNIGGNTVICDLGNLYYQPDLYREMDILIWVLDPLPSRLIAGMERLSLARRLQAEGRRSAFVINRWNDGVNRREFSAFFKEKNRFYLPLISQELIYKGEYNCTIPWGQKEIKAEMKPNMEKIWGFLGI